MCSSYRSITLLKLTGKVYEIVHAKEESLKHMSTCILCIWRTLGSVCLECVWKIMCS